MPQQGALSGLAFPGKLADPLVERGVDEHDEVAPRNELDRRLAGYNLVRLTLATVI